MRRLTWIIQKGSVEPKRPYRMETRVKKGDVKRERERRRQVNAHLLASKMVVGVMSLGMQTACRS